MLLTVDLDNSRLLDAYGQPVTAIDHRYGGDVEIRIKFQRGGTFIEPASVGLIYTVKTFGKFDQDPPLALTSTFAKEGTGSDAVWIGSAAIYGPAIADLLLVDGTDTNDAPTAAAMSEVYYTIPGASDHLPKLTTTISNSLYRGTESTPILPPPGAQSPSYLPLVTGHTGGTATDLDGQPTAGVSIPRLYEIVVDSIWYSYQLRARTEADVVDGITIIDPVDSDPATNNKVFENVTARDGGSVLVSNKATSGDLAAGTANKWLDTAVAKAGMDSRDTANRDRANHTGTQSADTLTDGATNKAFLATERTKLAGIASGATANSSDATLLARANHTGTQLAATISDFAGEVRATVLTGVSFVTATAVTAADSALVAWGKLQAQITTLTGRTITGAGLATGGGDLSANRTITVTKATATEVVAGTDDTKAVTPLGVKAGVDARVAFTLAAKATVFDGSWSRNTTFSAVSMAGDFTISGYIYRENTGNAWVIGDTLGSSDLEVSSGGNLRQYTAFPASVSSTATIPLNVWTPFAVTRAGTTYSFYVGQSVSTAVDAGVLSDFSVLGGVSSSSQFSGKLARIGLWNSALSSTDVSELFANLGIPRRERLSGGTFSYGFEDGASAFNFDLGGSGYVIGQWSSGTASNYNGTADADSVGGAHTGTKCLKIVTSVNNDGFVFSPTSARKFYTVEISFWYYIKTGQPNFDVISSDTLSTLTVSGSTTVKGTWTQVTVTYKQGAGGGVPVLRLATPGTAYFDDFVAKVQGATYIQPDADQGSGPVLRAATGSDTLLPGDGHETGGVVRGNPLLAPYTLKYSVSGSGNRLVGGVDVRRIPTGWKITSLATNLSVSAALTVGTTSGAADVVASVTPGTGYRQLTPVQPLPDPSRLWISGTITGDIYITIAP